MIDDLWCITGPNESRYIRVCVTNTWLVTCDMWFVTCNTWHATCDMWLVTCDVWHVIRDKWYVTCDEWQIILSYLCSLIIAGYAASSSLGGMFCDGSGNWTNRPQCNWQLGQIIYLYLILNESISYYVFHLYTLFSKINAHWFRPVLPVTPGHYKFDSKRIIMICSLT